MARFEFMECPLEGACLIKGGFSSDARGCFYKDFEENEYSAGRLPFHCTESFYSVSGKHVLRGLHFQTRNPQAKLVTVIQGCVFDVVVDLRKGSRTFGRWFSAVLSDENRHVFYIPKGFAHGFLALGENSVVSYKCDGKYCPGSDSGIRHDDLDLQIEWPVRGRDCIVSERDRKLMAFREFIRDYGGL